MKVLTRVAALILGACVWASAQGKDFDSDRARKSSADLSPDMKAEARRFFSSGFQLLEKKLPDAAVIQFQSGLQIDPAEYKAWFMLGTAYESTNHMELAVEAYEAVKALAPPTSDEAAVSTAKLAAIRKVRETSPEGIRETRRTRFLEALEALGPGQVVAVRGSAPSNLSDLVAYLERGGSLMTGVTSEVFRTLNDKLGAGLPTLALSLVPYKSEAAVIQDFRGGLFDVAILSSNSAKALEAAGGRLIAVSAPNRLPQLASVPTLREALKSEVQH
jgi:tetratricopeptide (TPR) repeat protein